MFCTQIDFCTKSLSWREFCVSTLFFLTLKKKSCCTVFSIKIYHTLTMPFLMGIENHCNEHHSACFPLETSNY